MNEIPGQTNIFDFLGSDGKVKELNFDINDSVKINYYDDETEVVTACHPQLLGVGVIVNKKCDFFRAQFGDSFVWVEKSKLIKY